MPWISKEKCIGCGVCVKICPAGAISMKEGKAEINMENCIRCGKCHDVCSYEAVRHDGERIPIEVKENVEKTKRLMENFKTEKEKQEFLGRMKKYFNKEKIVAEKTLEKIKNIMEDKNA
ncbi:ferredoxin [Candidatus Altiarchaeales archaeon WOR_SM1_SCG]|nr:ferredoxin [Candidatus Altiarchaeales archaeon WOR_SM1_SCG]ODS37714.1 MAG: ferredoxin [Candidatus Altiarchaeales archaeon WOR_SM1_86-2]